MIGHDEKPTLLPDDMEDLTYLFSIFDEVHFNWENGMYATLECKMGSLGNVVISYILRQNHAKIYPTGAIPGNETDLFNGYYGENDEWGNERPQSAQELITWAKRVVLEEINKSIEGDDDAS